MANPDKKILQSATETKKVFSYELDGVSINFTMRTDIKKELKAGIQILERAIADFKKELDAMQ